MREFTALRTLWRDRLSSHAAAVLAERWCIVATTPGGVYGMLKDAEQELTGHRFCQCLVLDEASQMNLPEALLAAAPLAPDGQLIVVGDDRQMPPIITHDWAQERRRMFQQYRAYESLFVTLRAQQPPMIRLAESFRLHADMAAFLRREIYAQDGIAYFSRRTDSLASLPRSSEPAAEPVRAAAHHAHSSCTCRSRMLRA